MTLLEHVTEALKPVVRHGLPVVAESATDLLHLRCVSARAVDDDVISRVDALDTILREILDEGTSTEMQAMRALFGVTGSLVRTNLTTRRIAAASLLAYDLDHFRKHREPAIRRAVAHELVCLNLRYQRRFVVSADLDVPAPAIPDPGDDLALLEDSARLWSMLYTEYTELLAAWRSEGELGGSGLRHIDRALWCHAQLLDRTAAFFAEHGQSVISMNDSVACDRFLTVMGRPRPFTDEEAVQLRLLATVCDSADEFVDRLIRTLDGRRLRKKWQHWSWSPRSLPIAQGASA